MYTKCCTTIVGDITSFGGKTYGSLNQETEFFNRLNLTAALKAGEITSNYLPSEFRRANSQRKRGSSPECCAVGVAMVLEKIKCLLKKEAKKKTIACFVDGPNILRKELHVDLEKVKRKLDRFGRLKIAKVYLDQYASDKLIEAVTNQGFDVVIVPSDVDVALAVDAAEFTFHEGVDIIAIVSRDSDFRPVLTKAKVHGKDTIVVGCEPDFSTALRNTADVVVDLKE